MAFQKQKKEVELVALQDLLSGKVKPQIDDTPKISKGAILDYKDNSDGTFTVKFRGCTDEKGNPSVWESVSGKHSIMLCHTAETVKVKTADVRLTISMRFVK